MIETTNMGALRKSDCNLSLTFTLPLDLCEEIEVRSKSLDIGLDQLVNTLLRFGLQVQREREEALDRLVNRMRNTDDPQEKKRLSDELGNELFGDTLHAHKNVEDFVEECEGSHRDSLLAQKERGERGFREGRLTTWNEVKRRNDL